MELRKEKRKVAVLILIAVVMLLFIVYNVYTEFKQVNLESKEVTKAYIKLYFLHSPIVFPIDLTTNSTEKNG